jgi:hypothetical protein
MEDDLVFEAFETSAISEKVLASEGALLWDFPGRAVSIPYQVYSDEDFQTSIATWLEQASIESLKQFAAITFKAAAPMPEIRDTTNPALISGSMMSILEANGAIHNPKILRKRVRDSVSFQKAKMPWRRSPFYLVIRVAIQRHLYRLFGPEVVRVYYKTIVAVFVSQLLEESLDIVPHEASHFLQRKSGRRLTKLEQVKSVGSECAGAQDGHLLSGLRTVFETILKNASRLLKDKWEQFRSSTQRVIRPLPQHADRWGIQPDDQLQLHSSGQILNEIAFGGFAGFQNPTMTPLELLNRYQQSGAKAKPFAAVANRHLKIVKTHDTQVQLAMVTKDCRDQARAIETYITFTGNAFVGYPELMGRFILELMELWVQMDRNAVIEFPLLKQYHPAFDPSILDALELPTLNNMRRVKCVQVYLCERCHRWVGSG